GMNPDVMLANAADRCARDALEAPPLLGKGAMVLERREAAVEPDLMAAAADLREDPACLRGLGTIGEIARADRGERGRAAENEPRRVDPGVRLPVEDSGHPLKDRAESERSDPRA